MTVKYDPNVILVQLPSEGDNIVRFDVTPVAQLPGGARWYLSVMAEEPVGRFWRPIHKAITLVPIMNGVTSRGQVNVEYQTAPGQPLRLGAVGGGGYSTFWPAGPVKAPNTPLPWWLATGRWFGGFIGRPR